MGLSAGWFWLQGTHEVEVEGGLNGLAILENLPLGSFTRLWGPL